MGEDRDFRDWHIDVRVRARASAWMSARVVAVDVDQRKITVTRTRSSDEGLKGVAFWDAAGMEPLTSTVKGRLDIVRSWLADTREEPVYELSMDESADIIINGRSQPIEAIQAGDGIGIYSPGAEDGSFTLRPICVRVYQY